MLTFATNPKRNHKGELVLIEMPRRGELMELATSDVFDALRVLTVGELQTLRPTGKFVALMDGLIAMRQLME